MAKEDWDFVLAKAAGAEWKPGLYQKGVGKRCPGKGAGADMFIGIGVGEGGVLSIPDRFTCQ
jgi:hypothetical protein